MSELEKQRNQLKELSKGLTFDEQQRRQHELDHTALLSGYTVSGKPFGVTINKMSLAVFSGQALSVICSNS